MYHSIHVPHQHRLGQGERYLHPQQEVTLLYHQQRKEDFLLAWQQLSQ